MPNFKKIEAPIIRNPHIKKKHKNILLEHKVSLHINAPFNHLFNHISCFYFPPTQMIALINKSQDDTHSSKI
jgi:hypothetical protein